MGGLYYNDDLERKVSKALTEAGVSFTHRTQDGRHGFDFYVKNWDTCIEVRRFQNEPLNLEKYDSVIVLQGRAAVDVFIKMLEKWK